MYISHSNYIGGTLISEGTGGTVPVFNPAREVQLSSIPDSSASVVDAAVQAAKRAQVAWARRPAIERAAALRAIASRIRDRVEPIAKVISEEQGKVLPLATVEVQFTAAYLDYMAEWARRIEGETIQSDRPGETMLLFRKPIGVVAGILPWNFPFFLIARKLGPALVTGNTIVVKPSEETPNNAMEFIKLLEGLDIPAGVINFVFGTGAVAGDALSRHPDIGLISFTGSVQTGSRIMAAAAENLTKVNLELGGKAPAIVLRDADIPLAVEAITASRTLNSGQVCNAAERVYVEASIADQFTDSLATAMKKVRFGDPLGEAPVDMGPLINRDGLNKVDDLVRSAVRQGGAVVTGGGIADRGAGYFFEPTVIAGCRAEMDVMRREIFGPVLPIMAVESLDEAIMLSNDSEYGLTSSVYTRSLSSAMKAIKELSFGETYVNRENFEAMQGFHAGMRKSGIGGADGKHGVYEYTATQVAYIQS